MASNPGQLEYVAELGGDPCDRLVAKIMQMEVAILQWGLSAALAKAETECVARYGKQAAIYGTTLHKAFQELSSAGRERDVAGVAVLRVTNGYVAPDEIDVTYFYGRKLPETYRSLQHDTYGPPHEIAPNLRGFVLIKHRGGKDQLDVRVSPPDSARTVGTGRPGNGRYGIGGTEAPLLDRM